MPNVMHDERADYVKANCPFNEYYYLQFCDVSYMHWQEKGRYSNSFTG